jgi:hypothetical protein
VISDQEAEDAIDWMKANAKRIGLLRGRMVAAEEGLRRVKSLEMVEIRQAAEKRTVAEIEALAYSSTAYGLALKELEESTADYETEKIYLNAADLQVRAWQSMHSASRRGM